MKLKGSLTTPTCGRFYGKKLNLVVLSQLVGFFNSLQMTLMAPITPIAQIASDPTPIPPTTPITPIPSDSSDSSDSSDP